MGTRAIVVFESGRADLIVLDNIKTPSQHQIANEGVIFGGFDLSAGSERFLTATKEGNIQMWEFVSGQLKKTRAFYHGKTPIGIAGFSKEGKRLVSVGDDGTFRVWDITGDHLSTATP